MFRRLVQLVNDLFSVNTHLSRRRQAKSYLISTHMEHGDRNVIADAQRLTNPTSENEHIPISDSNQDIADTRFDLESVCKDTQCLNRQVNPPKVHRGDYLKSFDEQHRTMGCRGVSAK